MIDVIAKRIGEFQIKHTKKMFIVFLVLTLLILPGIIFLPGNVEPSLEKVMPSFIEELSVINHMRTQFGSDITYIILRANAPLFDVRSKASLEYINTLQQAFNKRELLVSSESISNYYSSDTFPPSAVQNSDLIGPNFDFTIIKVVTDTGSDAQKIKLLLDGLNTDIDNLESVNPGFSFLITGFNVIDRLIFNVIMSDFLVITFVSMSLIAVIQFLFFRDFKKVALSMSVMFFAVIWTMGVVGYLGLTITVVSMVSIAMLMGLGIDFSVHFMHSFYDNLSANSLSKSIVLTQKELFRAVLGAASTTIAGFLALLFGVLPAMKVLAIILSIGIFFTLLGAIGFLPLLLIFSSSKVIKNVK